MIAPSIDQLSYVGSLAASAGIGLAMAGHCFGMCGALVSVIGMTGSGRPVCRILAYNLGRITTYALLGLAAAAVGQRLQIALAGSWLPRAVAIVSCAIMVFSALALMGLVSDRFLGAVFPSRLLARFMVRPTPLVPSPVKTYLLGLLFGLLPCAATFGMLGAAMISGTWHRGALMLVAFGLGTLPVMTGVPLVAQTARRFGRTGYGRAAGSLLLLLAVASLWELWQMSSASAGGCCH